MKILYYAMPVTLAVLTSCKPASAPEGIVAAASPPPSENTDSNSENAAATLEPDTDTALPTTMFETREAYWEYCRHLRDEQLAEYEAFRQNPTLEALEAYEKNAERRREKERAAAALAPPPDPRQAAWFANYLGPNSYKAPPHIREDYYRYLLETYAGWDRERAIEERSRFGRGLGTELASEGQFERHCELTDYISALLWQSWREEYADWDITRVKEEMGRFTDIENERPLTEEERQRHWELFGVMGVFRREYLLEKYAGWDIARAEEEAGRLGTLQLSTEERLARSWELLHYIGILRHEAQDPPAPAP